MRGRKRLDQAMVDAWRDMRSAGIRPRDIAHAAGRPLASVIGQTRAPLRPQPQAQRTGVAR